MRGEAEVEETHREGFEHEAFASDAVEEDAGAAAGDSGELRHEEIQRRWVWIGGVREDGGDLVADLRG